LIENLKLYLSKDNIFLLIINKLIMIKYFFLILLNYF